MQYFKTSLFHNNKHTYIFLPFTLLLYFNCFLFKYLCIFLVGNFVVIALIRKYLCIKRP